MKGVNTMNTKEEMNKLKENVEPMNKKFAEIAEEDLEQVSGGSDPSAKVPDSPLKKCLDQQAYIG